MARTTKSDPRPQAPGVDDALAQMHAHPGFLLRRAQQIAAAVFMQETDGELTPPQFSTLTLIGLLPGIDQVTVGRVIGLDRTTIAVVTTNLVKRGWVERTQDPQDGRRYSLRLTAAGRAMAAKARKRADRCEQRLLSAFSPADGERFVALLRQFVEHFNDDSSAPIVGGLVPIR